MYAANTAYVDFVNALMHPDPNKRLSAKEALNHPFLKNRMLDDNAAKDQIKNLIGGRKTAPDAKDVQFQTSPEIEDTTWTRTMNNALQAGAVTALAPEVGAVAQALASYEMHRDTFKKNTREAAWDAKKTAGEEGLKQLDAVAAGIRTLQTQPEYAANQTMSRYLTAMAQNIAARRREFQEVLNLGAPEITTDNFHAAWSTKKSLAESA